MASNTLKLSDKGTEYPARFGGNEVTYATVEAGATPAETLETFLRNFVSPDLSDADAAQVVADYFNGYGLTYRRNGIVKRVLDSEDVKDLDVAEAIKRATDAANEDRVGVTARKGDGKGSAKKRAEAAEAEAAKKAAGAREMYLGLSKSQRKQFRPMLLAQGTFTEAELDTMDAEAEQA